MKGRPEPGRRSPARVAAACALAALLFAVGALAGQPARANGYPDIGNQPAEIQSAIDYVTSRGYMNGAGDGNFYPNEPVKRLEYACSLVRLFKKQGEKADVSIHFSDLADSDPNYRYANIAVRHGYISSYPDGSFRPYVKHAMVSCLAGLVKGLGLADTNGPVFCAWGIWPRGPAYSGQAIIGSDLHLKYRSTRAWPTGPYPRGELAYSIQKAEQPDQWRLDYIRQTFTRLGCQSPLTGPLRRKALDCAFSKIGYPYVWGGESDAEGGYDCSGLTYFVLQSVLGYPMQRVADDQAKDGRYAVVPRESLLPGDPIFFYQDPATSSYIGHAGMYIGRGLFIHSTGSNAGVSVDFLSGYWSDHFAWGKRVIGEAAPDSFETYMLLQNPDDSPAQVRLTYMLRDGRQVTEDRTLDPHSRKTVKANDSLVDEEFSTRVDALQGEVIAERSMYFDYRDAWSGGHDVIGARTPSPAFYFAEGTCRPNFEPYLCIQNPGGSDSALKITYMKGDGSTQEQTLVVAASSRSTVSVKDVLGEGDDAAHDFSCKVETTNGRNVVCERPVYFNYRGVWTGGHDVVGALSPAPTFYFAEGTCRTNFEPYLCIQNPNDADSAVSITYIRGDGTKKVQTLTVGRKTRYTVRVKDVLGQGNSKSYDFACKVETTNGQNLVCERPMYFDYGGVWTGGHDVVGASSPASTFYFAEGTCRPNFEPYLCVANVGNSDEAVKITYMKGDGSTEEQTIDVAGNSRYTVRVKDVLGEGYDTAHDFSCRVETTGAQDIVCERPMYFNYSGKTGGHDVIGVNSPARVWYFAEGYTGR